MTFISEAETYQEDFELFQNLGLKIPLMQIIIG